MLGFLNKKLLTYLNLVSVRKFVDDRFIWVLAKFFQAALKISSNIANLFLCVFGVAASSFFSTVREVNSILLHELHEVLCEVLSGKAHLLNGMGQSKTFVDRDSRSQGIS